MGEPVLERQHDLIGFGDGVTRVFMASVRYPVYEPCRAYLVPVGILDALIDPVERPDAGATLIVTPSTGSVRLEFPEPPPKGYQVFVTYLWQPPRLRGCKVRVRLADGSEEWASLEDLWDTRRC